MIRLRSMSVALFPWVMRKVEILQYAGSVIRIMNFYVVFYTENGQYWKNSLSLCNVIIILFKIMRLWC